MTNFLNVLFGSTAVASAISASELLGPGGPKIAKLVGILAAVLVTVVSTIDLVVDTSTASRNYSDLAKRFIDLEREITLAEPMSEKTLREFGAKRLMIEGDEPPIMRMLDILCQNELLLAMGYPKTDTWKVGWVKRRLAQVIDFDTEKVEKVKTKGPKAGLPAETVEKHLLS